MQAHSMGQVLDLLAEPIGQPREAPHPHPHRDCLLYTSDAADERSSVDLGGRRIIKKKKNEQEEGLNESR